LKAAPHRVGFGSIDGPVPVAVAEFKESLHLFGSLFLTDLTVPVAVELEQIEAPGATATP
jgi:hypothetical protein